MFINKIAVDCGEPNLPKQIYEACLKKQAFLFVRDRAGFVLKPFIEDGVSGVLVWAAWSERRDGLDEYTELVKLLSRKINAKFLRFHTVRRGFLRVGNKYGWRHIGNDVDGMMIFEMTL